MSLTGTLTAMMEVTITPATMTMTVVMLKKKIQDKHGECGDDGSDENDDNGDADEDGNDDEDAPDDAGDVGYDVVYSHDQD